MDGLRQHVWRQRFSEPPAHLLAVHHDRRAGPAEHEGRHCPLQLRPIVPVHAASLPCSAALPSHHLLVRDFGIRRLLAELLPGRAGGRADSRRAVRCFDHSSRAGPKHSGRSNDILRRQDGVHGGDATVQCAAVCLVFMRLHRLGLVRSSYMRRSVGYAQSQLHVHTPARRRSGGQGDVPVGLRRLRKDELHRLPFAAAVLCLPLRAGSVECVPGRMPSCRSCKLLRPATQHSVQALQRCLVYDRRSCGSRLLVLPEQRFVRGRQQAPASNHVLLVFVLQLRQRWIL
jgi:hypothetical protein